jgi:predicted acyltransferase
MLVSGFVQFNCGLHKFNNQKNNIMNEHTLKLQDRIISIDALRGFAMFLILSTQIGGAPIFQTFIKLWGENFANAVSSQMTWDTQTVTFLNIAQSIFVFVVGLVIPFSLYNRLLRTDKKRIYLHIIKRALILFLLGLIAGGKLLNLHLATLPVYNNVLEYISISYLVCAILVLNTTTLVQYILTGGFLLLVWAIFLFIPAPGWHGDIYSQTMNIGIYIENVVLGQHGSHFGSWTGVLNTFGHISTMLLGVLMSNIIFSTRNKIDKTKLLYLGALVMYLAGWIWGQFFPIMRNYMTSSFVLESCGISTFLLASFYLIIDVWGYSKWAFFFIVFGVNSIAIYMMAHLFDFRLIGNIFVGGLSSLFASNVQDFIQAVAAMMVMWLIMYWMYCKKTFIKI